MLDVSRQVNRVLQRAVAITQELRHDYVGTAHIMFGLLYADSSVCDKVWSELRVNVKDLREDLSRSLLSGPVRTSVTTPPYTLATRLVLVDAAREAVTMCASFADTEHLLLGLIKNATDIAAKLLREYDVNYERVREIVVALSASAFVAHEPVTAPKGDVVDPGVLDPNVKPMRQLTLTTVNALLRDDPDNVDQLDLAHLYSALDLADAIRECGIALAAIVLPHKPS